MKGLIYGVPYKIKKGQDIPGLQTRGSFMIGGQRKIGGGMFGREENRIACAVDDLNVHVEYFGS